MNIKQVEEQIRFILEPKISTCVDSEVLEQCIKQLVGVSYDYAQFMLNGTRKITTNCELSSTGSDTIVNCSSCGSYLFPNSYIMDQHGRPVCYDCTK